MPPGKIWWVDGWSQALLFKGVTSFSSWFFFNILEISAQIKDSTKYLSNHMRASPNLTPTYAFLSSRFTWSSIPCSNHSPDTLKTSGIPNYVVCATNSQYTKPRASILVSGALNLPNHMPTQKQSTVTSFCKKKPWCLMWLKLVTL